MGQELVQRLSYLDGGILLSIGLHPHYLAKHRYCLCLEVDIAIAHTQLYRL